MYFNKSLVFFEGGRVVIFQRDDDYNLNNNNTTASNKKATTGDYRVYTTFQSHEPEFDYLKSLEIEEKINKIRWLKRKNPAHFLLSTNDKTIKLWKISEKDKKIDGNFNIRDDADASGHCFNDVQSLILPQIKPMDLVVEATPKRIYANAHTYHINSISINSDQETYLSADDLRLYCWNLENNSTCFNIVDIKPVNMEELTEGMLFLFFLHKKLIN